MNIGGKQFMNLQEAVGWLLQNNALPFQCNVNYVANTEIAKTAIINPSPAQIKVGSLVLFADSKVGTVSGLTSNGFMVGSDYTDIHNALAYISNVSINASGYLICTLSDGTIINAGIVKQIANFSINGSQHLIANYNDGTSTDLGAIFSGNVNISGNLTADSIIENMTGYSMELATVSADKGTITGIYGGIVKNGNKLTIVIAYKFTKAVGATGTIYTGKITVPLAIGNKIFPYSSTIVSSNFVSAFASLFNNVSILSYFVKNGSTVLNSSIDLSDLVEGTEYYIRQEITLLLSENLIA